MVAVKKGDKKGFLVATGECRRSPTNHLLFEYRCLICGTGTTWKRASESTGVSCGCLKSLHGKIWASCYVETSDPDHAKALHALRYQEELQKIASRVFQGEPEKETRPAELDGESDHPMEVGLEEAPEPPVSETLAAALTDGSMPSEEKTSEAPSILEKFGVAPRPERVRKPRKPREKAAKTRKEVAQPVAVEERQAESPTMADEQPMTEPSVKTPSADESTPSCS